MHSFTHPNGAIDKEVDAARIAYLDLQLVLPSDERLQLQLQCILTVVEELFDIIPCG